MGRGDQLIATGLARGAAARGKRIAFGVRGGHTCWDGFSEEIFRNNPNIAKPSTEHLPDVEWIDYRKGHRLYNEISADGTRWIWKDFHPQPGELFFDQQEKEAGFRYGGGFMLIEPNVDRLKESAGNKDWGFDRYQKLANVLRDDCGLRVAQFRYRGARELSGVEMLDTRSFRDALSILGWAGCYIGPEGGLHHGAAAVGIPATVIFGGFASPAATGYAGHSNLTGDSPAPCGSLRRCEHCRQALKSISVPDVLRAVLTCSS